MKVEFKVTDAGIIIDNTNYGNLVDCHLPNGTTVVMDKFYVELVFGRKDIKTTPFSGMVYIPLDLKLERDNVKHALEMDPQANVSLLSGSRDFYFWSASKATLDAVASYMSTLGERLTVGSRARNLGIYEHGVEVAPRKKLTDFYIDITPEETEETTW